MREKKNIDRLFQEKFKDFEVHPGNHVWDNIASQKEEKEKRKIIPFWLRLGGVAAALAILVTLGIILFNNDSSSTENLVDTETAPPNNIENVVSNKQQNTNTTTPSTLSTIENLDTNNDDLTSSSDTSPKETTNSQYAENKTSEQQNEALKKSLQSENFNRLKTGVAQNSEATTSSQNTPNDSQPLNSITSTSQNTVETAVVIRPENNLQKPNDLNSFEEPQNLGIDTKTEDAITQNTTSENNNTVEKGENNQKSLIEEAKSIEATREEALASLENNSKKQRWDVGAVAAPVYYGDFGGSGIDPEFKDNKKSGDVNLSYGVQVSYALSSKFKVRTGINNIDLSYSTEDIAFSPDIEARELKGINYTPNAKFLNITDSSNQINAFAESDVQGGGRSVTPGSINQQVAYVEIPVEAVYVISDKRFGLELIGGVSTLILNDDKISLESSEGLRTTVGSSNSLNEVSLTTNLGVGLNYKITDNVKVNMEPTFKYQVNAFDKSAGDFKPYYLGLYTGVSYRF